MFGLFVVASILVFLEDISQDVRVIALIIGYFHPCFLWIKMNFKVMWS